MACQEIYQCKSCDLKFAYPLPKKKELDLYYSGGFYYDQVSDPFQRKFFDFSYRLAQCRMGLIKNNVEAWEKIQKVIDIGAGNAAFGAALKAIDYDISYTAIEPDNAVSAQYGDWVDHVFKDVSEVQEAIYCLVVANQVLEHVPDPIDFLHSIIGVIVAGGYLYIDVPYNDYLYKPSVEPHLLFWTPESLSNALRAVGMTIVFCDTAGMTFKQAEKFFQPDFVSRAVDPWLYAEKINRLMLNLGMTAPFDLLRKFHANEYGGDRQWLRCIARKPYDYQQYR